MYNVYIDIAKLIVLQFYGTKLKNIDWLTLTVLVTTIDALRHFQTG